MRRLEQHLLTQEQDARQPRLTMEADGPADTKTRERTEGAATAVQEMRRDGFSARRVKPGPNTNSTSFGVKAEPPALLCRDDVLVECGDAASDSCLILGDALTNGRWWLSSHRRSLHRHGDQFQRPNSSVLLDRGDGSGGEKFMNFSSIRVIRQQQRLPGEEPVCYSLLPEGR